MNKSHIRSIIYILVCITALLTYKFGRGFWVPSFQKTSGKKTVESVIDQIGDKSRSRLNFYFSDANIAYPPKEVVLLALKREKVLEVWASEGKDFQLIHEYKIAKLSGNLGPKLKEGDRQVPEGIYRIVGLNPNSSYHLSMKLNYPNDFDLRYAKKEGRNQPGSDIFIHGKNVSIGCLAMGDQTIEDLFVLVHDVGKNNVKVVISPYDPRTSAQKTSTLDATLITGPEWLPELYQNISYEVNKYVKG